MSLYAISDLHLSHVHNRTMSRFGYVWDNHSEKIKNNWNAVVNNNDTVVVAGDITWATKLDEAMPDLEYIAQLNGKKIIVKGNHDYFWGSTQKLNMLFDNICFLQSSFTTYNEYAVCGTRGWLCPGDSYFAQGDNRLYNREVKRLELAFKEAIQRGQKNIIAVTHFAPTNDKREDSLFTELFAKYNITIAVYGHLHNIDSYYASRIGIYEKTAYYLSSCDYTGFSPIKILD